MCKNLREDEEEETKEEKIQKIKEEIKLYEKSIKDSNDKGMVMDFEQAITILKDELKCL